VSKEPKKTDLLRGLIIAIDGPSGAGKSTIAEGLARELNGIVLNTGAMYRSVAYHALLREKILARDLGLLAKSLRFDMSPDRAYLMVNGEDLGAKLRTEGVSKKASDVSAFRSVRTVLTQRQRQLAKKLSQLYPVVVEGRDIGTYVFPRTRFKFFVTAEPKVRAKRRLEQLRTQGVRGLTIKDVQQLNKIRDDQDSGRRHAPLRCAEDAIVVDTSSMEIEQVIRFMSDHVVGRRKLRMK